MTPQDGQHCQAATMQNLLRWARNLMHEYVSVWPSV